MRASLIAGGIVLIIVGMILFMHFNEVIYVEVGDSPFGGPMGYYRQRSFYLACSSLGLVFIGVVLIIFGAIEGGLDLMRRLFQTSRF